MATHSAPTLAATAEKFEPRLASALARSPALENVSRSPAGLHWTMIREGWPPIFLQFKSSVQACQA